MKKVFYLIGVIFVSAMGFVSCSSDDTPPPPSKTYPMVNAYYKVTADFLKFCDLYVVKSVNGKQDTIQMKADGITVNPIGETYPLIVGTKLIVKEKNVDNLPDANYLLGYEISSAAHVLNGGKTGSIVMKTVVDVRANMEANTKEMAKVIVSRYIPRIEENVAKLKCNIMNKDSINTSYDINWK